MERKGKGERLCGLAAALCIARAPRTMHLPFHSTLGASPCDLVRLHYCYCDCYYYYYYYYVLLDGHPPFRLLMFADWTIGRLVEHCPPPPLRSRCSQMVLFFV